MKVENGRVVSLNYTVRDDQGEVLESTEGRGPLEYLHGYNNIIPGLERELEGVESGETTQVTVEPAEAYGERNPEAIVEVAEGDLPEELELEPGMVVQAQTPQGPMQLTVLEMKEEGGAVFDANHPLAGKTLEFDVEVADVREATDEEKEHGHVHK